MAAVHMAGAARTAEAVPAVDLGPADYRAAVAAASLAVRIRIRCGTRVIRRAEILDLPGIRQPVVVGVAGQVSH